MLSDREIARHQFRVALFTRRGLDADRAEAVADSLIKRDAELDKRRLGLECAHLQRSGGCFAAAQGRMPGVPISTGRHFACLSETLQRCPCFEWVKPS